MADKITTFDTIQRLTIVKVLPLWLVRMCYRVGLFRFFSPFFALNEMGTLNDVVKVIIK